MDLTVVIEDDMHDTDDGCEFPFYAQPIIPASISKLA